jgi:hypothetical protein
VLVIGGRRRREARLGLGLGRRNARAAVPGSGACIGTRCSLRSR